MTDKPKDGGPAFPHLREYVAKDTYKIISDGGMSLRDYFAGQAVAGLSADPNYDQYYKDFGKNAYEIADALIAAAPETVAEPDRLRDELKEKVEIINGAALKKKEAVFKTIAERDTFKARVAELEEGLANLVHAASGMPVSCDDLSQGTLDLAISDARAALKGGAS